MKIKKILHVTSARQLSSGQRNQLKSEYTANLNSESVEWSTIAFHTGDSKEPFEVSIPRLFKPIFLRNMYIWLKVLSYQEDYDLILLRHMTFDPFALIFPFFIKNRISVHHSKEIEELKLIRKGWKGELASFIEKMTGKIAVKNTLGIAGVTKEIANYENTIRNLDKPLFFYPNGIDLKTVALAQDERQKEEINIIFICGTFSDWHGLDILLSASENIVFKQKIKIHLVGSVSESQILAINRNSNSNIFIVHGVLDSEDYYRIMSKCDIGLGSLALHRKGLKEASTLKVREMLAMGLPVYSGHIDGSLLDNLDYYYYKESFYFINIINFALDMKGVTREEVRSSAAQYISKESIMNDFLRQVDSILKK